jgi:hypothetical protein
MDFKSIASEEQRKKTIDSLKGKGYEVIFVKTGKEALDEIKETIPENASIMNGSSTTLQQIGYIDFLKSGESKWNNLHKKILEEKDPEKQSKLRKESVLSDYYLGSVHALVETGEFIIASNTGSQLPHVVYTSQNLIFVVSTKKIVGDREEGLKRLEEHVIPLENQRMQKAYGIDTTLNKIVIFIGENPMSNRKVKFILIDEDLGF